MINRDDYKSFLSVRPIDFVPRIEKQKQNNYTEFKTEDMVDFPYFRNKEGKVTVKLYYPKAGSLVLMLQRKPVEMRKEGDYFLLDTDLADGIYPVTVIVDGNMVLDPFLPIGFGHNQPFNFIDLIDKDAYWAEKDVPHGHVESHYLYNSVTQRNERVFVYLPAEFDPSKKYDVLFLQHGFGENETSWLSEGRIDFICDNLVAERKIEPLIIVMSNGMLYRKEEGRIKMLNFRFKDHLKEDLLPFVEKTYSYKDLYIAGLSMGSMQASITAIEYPDLFKGVGLFSGFLSDLISGYKEHLLPEKITTLSQNKFLMRGIGDTDRFLPIFEKEDVLLKEIDHVRKIYHGEHEWNVWREMIVDFLILREQHHE